MEHKLDRKLLKKVAERIETRTRFKRLARGSARAREFLPILDYLTTHEVFALGVVCKLLDRSVTVKGKVDFRTPGMSKELRVLWVKALGYKERYDDLVMMYKTGELGYKGSKRG